MEKVWVITFENYQDVSFGTEFFHHEENAKKRFLQLLEENHNQKEFQSDSNDWVFSYFDPRYNEYSTVIALEQTTMDKLFED